ncbi:hypothetical protein ZWY2020_050576 [Hordeum vulgare]|nr:hypothetical protein ZWY2020_050576 [Hordeum vulgare]
MCAYRWSAIATHLPKRTYNEIKNYWNTHLKKRLAKMGIDPVTHKPRSDVPGGAGGGGAEGAAGSSATRGSGRARGSRPSCARSPRPSPPRRSTRWRPTPRPALTRRPPR